MTDGLTKGPGSRLAVVLMVLPLLLSGCSYVPDWADPTEWFGDDEPALPSATLDDEAQIPNLASVPSEPRQSTPAELREQTVEGLTADRANAQYSSETLTAGGGVGDPQVPAAPSQSATLASAVNAANVPAVSTIPTIPSTTAPTPTPTAVPQTTQNQQVAAFQPAPAYQPPRQTLLAAVIYFEHGSAGLDTQDQEILRGVVQAQRQRNAQIVVVGHASSRTGTTTPSEHQILNFNISLKRANAVVNALRQLGVDSSVMSAEARANSQPVYHEFMPSGEAGNRRAEIFFLQ